MQEQAKSPKNKRGWLWLLVGMLAIAVLTAPVIKGYSLQSRAGKLIRAYVDELEAPETNPIKGNFYCLLPSFNDMPKSNELDRAIAWLNEAKSIAPKNIHSRLLLGQAFCLKQEYTRAIDVFVYYLVRRPDNQLAKAETGFAYSAVARSTSDSQNAQTYRKKGLQFLEEAGFSANSFIKFGDAAYIQERYQEAVAWYEIIESVSGLEISKLFRNGMLLELDNDLTIEPTNFFIFSSDLFVQTRAEADRTAGILSNNSQIASILLDINKANKYCVTLNALDYPPQPTKIGIVIDFMDHSMLELKNGDGSWVQFDFPVFLEKGIHVLGIKLMNDAYIEDEIDRNVHFGSVTIKACNDS